MLIGYAPVSLEQTLALQQDALTQPGCERLFTDTASRSWWADQGCLSAFADQAVSSGLTDRDELAAIAAAWRRWAVHPDGFFTVLHGKVVAHR